MRSSSKHLYRALAAMLAVSAACTAYGAPLPVTITFQNNAPLPDNTGDYTGTVDRRIGFQPNDGIAAPAFSVDGGDQALDDTQSCSVLMRFEDIQNIIPAGAKIIKAAVTVTQTTSGSAHSNNSFTVYRLAHAFDSDSDIGAGKDFGPDGLVGDVDMIVGSFNPPNIEGTASLVTADITRAVQSWVDGSPNYGIGIRSDRDRDGWSFNSTGAAQALRPKLEVTYILGDEVQLHSFQKGVNGYDASFDIYPNQRQDPANASSPLITKLGSNFPEILLDGVDPPKTDPDNPGMIKFGNVETAVAGKRIESAKLRIVSGFGSNVADSPGAFTVHRLLRPFSETSLYGDFAGAAGAMQAAGQITPPIASFTGMQDCEVMDVDVSKAVKAWAAGEPNYGLYIGSGTNNEWQIFTTGATTMVSAVSPFKTPMNAVSFRPELRVISTPQRPVIVTSPVEGTRHLLGVPITLQATATPEGSATVTKVEFLVDGTVVGTDTGVPFTFDYPADKLGNFVLTARLTDSASKVTDSDPIPFLVVPGAGSGGLYFDGISDHITLGNPAPLKLQNFTVETWFKRESKGTTTTTGGVTGIPLVAKGRNEADGSTLDTNWFLGIREADGVLLGDFESVAVSTPAIAAGANVPITGRTAVPYDQWNHAAMTFDGTFFRLYLNGSLEREIDAKGARPQSNSIQFASIATAMNSSGLGEGAFGGFMDEIRIWNVARSPEQIRQKINAEVTSDTGLVARWGMTEGTGRTITSTIAPAVTGNFGGDPIWTSGAIFNNNTLPTVVFTAPANGVTYASGEQVTVQVASSDPDGSVAKVEYYDNGVLSHTATTAPFSYLYTVLPGNRRFTAVITDNLGGNTTTDVGLLIMGTLPAPTVQGLSAALIDGGDEELFTGVPPVVPAPWAVVDSTNAPLAFTSPGTTSGEIDVRINGSRLPINSGVLLTTNVVLDGNTAAMDNHAPPYPEGGNYRVINWDNNGPGELQPVVTKESSSFSMGFFPYNKGWIGTTVKADGTILEGAGALPNGVTVAKTAVDTLGAYRISGLPVNGNVIAVAAGKDSDDVATVRRSGADDWEVLVRDNNQSAEDAPFTFLFIPEETGGVLSGQIRNLTEVGGLNREAAMVGVHSSKNVQGYEITFGDGSLINPSNTALFITGDGSAGNGADNIYSYFANGNSFTVFSHDLPGLSGVHQDGGFRFLAVPLNPRVPGNDEVAVSVTKAFGTEGVTGDNTLIFTIGRSGSTAAALNVNYTLGGTATAGSDYTAPSGVATIPAGQASVAVPVSILGDVVLEAEETLAVTLTAGGGYSLSPYITTFGTIRNAASNVESTTLTFQEGLGGYVGTFQRRIARDARNTTNTDSALNGSTNPGANGPVNQQNYGMDGGIPDVNDMLRFDNLIGTGPGQIPSGARILKAELSMLTIVAADAQSGGPFAVGRLTQPVDYTTTYDLVHGGDSENVKGIRGIVDREKLSAGFGAAVQGLWNTADVTAVLRDWVEEGVPNHGFGLFASGTEDAWSYCTMGNNTLANRPKLVVTYTTVPTERYNLTADRSALFTSRTDTSTTDGATITNQGYIKTAPNDTQEAMIRFPLLFDNTASGAIPLDREIVKAELMIRTGGNFDSWTSGNAAIHQVIAPWTTSTTFGLNGAKIGLDVAASSTAMRGMGRDSYAWTDVTSIVRNWRAGATNEGFSLKLSNAQNWGFHFPGDQNSAFAPVLRITTNRGSAPPVETPFEEWARLAGAEGISLTSDDDGDGIRAVVEYALGFNPRAHNMLPGITRNGSTVSISFPKGAAAAADTKVGYEIWSSTNLVDWTQETTATQDVSTISLSRADTENKKFYRLKIVYTP